MPEPKCPAPLRLPIASTALVLTWVSIVLAVVVMASSPDGGAIPTMTLLIALLPAVAGGFVFPNSPGSPPGEVSLGCSPRWQLEAFG